METNLLLLDSYKDMERLISFAFSFSNHFKRKLKIIYVFDFVWMSQPYITGATGPVDPGLVIAENQARKEFDVAEAEIRRIAGEYVKNNSLNIPFEISISETNRIDLVKENMKENPDLMLLLSNYQSYAEASGGLIGYPKIIEHVECPVFIIPKDLNSYEFKDVVYATDFNPEDITSLKHLSNFLKQSENYHITVFHNEKEYNFNEKLKWAGFKQIVQDEIEHENMDFSLKTKNKFLKGVEEYTEEHNPDLLVVMKEKKGFFEQVFTSNEIKNVLTHFNKPVLVYHEK